MDREAVKARLADLAEGALTPEEARAVEASLADHADLQTELEDLREAIRLAGELSEVEMPPDLAGGIRKAVDRAALTPAAPAIPLWSWTSAVAAMLLLTVGLALLSRDDGARPTSGPVRTARFDEALESNPATEEAEAEEEKALADDVAPREEPQPRPIPVPRTARPAKPRAAGAKDAPAPARPSSDREQVGRMSDSRTKKPDPAAPADDKAPRFKKVAPDRGLPAEGKSKSEGLGLASKAGRKAIRGGGGTRPEARKKGKPARVTKLDKKHKEAPPALKKALEKKAEGKRREESFFFGRRGRKRVAESSGKKAPKTEGLRHLIRQYIVGSERLDREPDLRRGDEDDRSADTWKAAEGLSKQLKDVQIALATVEESRLVSTRSAVVKFAKDRRIATGFIDLPATAVYDLAGVDRGEKAKAVDSSTTVGIELRLTAAQAAELRSTLLKFGSLHRRSLVQPDRIRDFAGLASRPPRSKGDENRRRGALSEAQGAKPEGPPTAEKKKRADARPAKGAAPAAAPAPSPPASAGERSRARPAPSKEPAGASRGLTRGAPETAKQPRSAGGRAGKAKATPPAKGASKNAPAPAPEPVKGAPTAKDKARPPAVRTWILVIRAK